MVFTYTIMYIIILSMGMNFKLNKKTLAFTLAEVLITLGIIGVVASMTMPALITNVRGDRLQAQFKKLYSELNQSALKFYVDNGISFTEYTISTYQDSDGVLAPDDTSSQLEKFMKYFKGSKIYSGNIFNENYTLEGITTAFPCDRSSVYTDSAGRIFRTDDNPKYGNYSYGPKICVDINGKNKPNKWGVDRFVFVFTKSNAVIPFTGVLWATLQGHGTLSEDELKQYCRAGMTTPAHTCAYFAVQNKSPDGNGDYWHDFIKGK